MSTDKEFVKATETFFLNYDKIPEELREKEYENIEDVILMLKRLGLYDI